jgi:cobalamin biosynthesis protein CbiD
MFNKSMIALPVAIILSVLGLASAALARMPPSDNEDQTRGFVIWCSLDGVNPVYHPSIFGNPAVARSYGFVQWPDHTWHVQSNCLHH